MTQVKRKYSISTPYVFQVCQISLAEASCTGTSLAGTSLILIVVYMGLISGQCQKENFHLVQVSAPLIDRASCDMWRHKRKYHHQGPGEFSSALFYGHLNKDMIVA